MKQANVPQAQNFILQPVFDRTVAASVEAEAIARQFMSFL